MYGRMRRGALIYEIVAVTLNFKLNNSSFPTEKVDKTKENGRTEPASFWDIKL